MANEKPLATEEMKAFGGMATSIDARDAEAGQATLQINVTAIRPGELNIRRGLAEVSFDEGT